MIKLKQVLFAIFIIQSTLYIRGQSLMYQQISEDTARTYGKCVLHVNSNEYIFSIGSTNYSNNKMIDAFLLKSDSLLNVKWVKKYDVDITDSSYYNSSRHLIKGESSGFLLGGTLGNNLITPGYLMKIAEIGNLIWSRSFNCWPVMPIREYKDGSIMIWSATHNYPQSYSAIVSKLDSNGKIIWAKRFLGNYQDYKYDYLYNSVIANDGSVLITGYSNGNKLSIYVLKVDSSGTIDFARRFINKDTTYGVNSGYSIFQTPDSGFIVSPYLYNSSHSNPYTQALFKIDKQGNFKWAKRYLTTDNNNETSELAKIFALPNGDILSLGMIYNENNGINYTGTLLCTDKNGNVKWHRHYDNFNPDISTQFYDLTQTLDNGFMIVGSTAQLPLKEHLYIVKTDSLGHTGCDNEKDINTWSEDLYFDVIDGDSVADFNLTSTNLPVFVSDVDIKFNTICTTVGIDENEKLKIKNEQLIIYPNPAITTIQVETLTNTGTLQITDINGKVVLTKEIKELKENIDITALPQGLYFVRAVTGGGVYNGRFFVKM